MAEKDSLDLISTVDVQEIRSTAGRDFSFSKLGLLSDVGKIFVNADRYETLHVILSVGLVSFGIRFPYRPFFGNFRRHRKTDSSQYLCQKC